MLRRTTLMVLCVAVTVFATLQRESIAHSGAQGVVKERMDGMKEMQKAAKALHAMLTGKQKLDQTAAAAHAQSIRDQAGNHMTRLFPPGSLHHPSEARQEIWEQWPVFEAESARLQTAAAALVRSLKADDGEAAVLLNRVGESCKSCHNRFRERQP